MHILRQKVWSPFIVGALIGILMAASYYLIHSFLGVSAAFVKLAELAMGWQSTYLQSTEIMAVLGIVIGSFISSFLSGSFTTPLVPNLWKKSFGDSFVARAFFAFVGGIIIILGARIAGGCTSGKAIVSGLQLLVHAWIFTACLFIAAVVTAHVLYRNK